MPKNNFKVKCFHHQPGPKNNLSSLDWAGFQDYMYM